VTLKWRLPGGQEQSKEVVIEKGGTLKVEIKRGRKTCRVASVAQDQDRQQSVVIDRNYSGHVSRRQNPVDDYGDDYG
jgi:hypothetical protein